MSYSRWSDSFWYTFWSVPPSERDEPENRDNAIFDICDVANFTAKELRDNLVGCLQYVEIIVAQKYKPECQVTEERKQELIGYIQQFLDDVDEEYQSDNKRNGADCEPAANILLN